VDDDVALLEMAGEILDAHYQVSLAKSGEQALEYLRWAANSGGSPASVPGLILFFYYAQISFLMLMVLLCLLFISALGIKPFFR
jgi:hypothetical protein